MFRMKSGTRSTDERERGFIDAARAAGLSVSFEAWIGNAVGEARHNALKALAKMDSVPQGIFTPNESTTRATLAALKEAGLAGQVKPSCWAST